jgi:rubrerythrin
MGLFVQNVVLGISDEKYLVEKVEIPEITKGKVDLTVKPGTIAIIGGIKYKGQEAPYKLTRENIGSKRASVDAYLYPDKMFDSISINFFGGQHNVSLSSLPGTKAKFSIVGTANIEIADFKDLANYFKASIKREDLVEQVTKEFRGHLSNEVNTSACKYITPETTEITLSAVLDSVSQDVMRSRKTSAMLANMGLMLSARGITMHLNALDESEEIMRIVNDAVNDKAIRSLDNDLRDREEREKSAERQHEIDMARANRTDISESTETRNYNTNGGNVTINNPAPKNKRYCPECGTEITSPNAKFCPSCGQKL